MFSCCSSWDLPWHSALRAALVASGSPGETSEPAGSEGPAAGEACRGGRAGYSALVQVDLLASALASSGSPEEGPLCPGGSWDGIHQDAFFWDLNACHNRACGPGGPGRCCTARTAFSEASRRCGNRLSCGTSPREVADHRSDPCSDRTGGAGLPATTGCCYLGNCIYGPSASLYHHCQSVAY